MASGKWYYSKDQLENSPSLKDDIQAARELKYRQDAAELIHIMGDKLHLTNAIINSAVTYMHRFYVYHSFVRFHRYPVAAASIFLAAKSESMPKNLESVIRTLYSCIYKKKCNEVNTESKDFISEAENVLYIEHIMIQTLGFELDIEHSHAYVLKFCQEIKANKDFAQACYFLATELLETTTMCLQYSPKVTASFCIYFVSKLTNWEIFESYQGKNWVYPDNDSDISLELLKKLEEEIHEQRTDAFMSAASTSSDGCSPPQQAGSQSVLGQGMPQQLANPSLKFEEVPSDLGQQLAQPI
ncbi:Similar to CycT: Cyclin-T (Drosophila melanogaster) [Cotesia congregata]|uniref:Similar to CycT: Cyclin-T (Drosophila melanogaster) n=1 Tax=Cotesia congregata TaxID=51543 RepID=A0A8J2H3C8_COTCN|nr:Similar to CycT: Cyclin-T (Drosophila melanogaster) [Cotesia congregata]